MKRSELKSLIKECLVEILADGLGDQLVEARSADRPSKSKRPPSQQRPGRLSEHFEKRERQRKESYGSDPVLDSPARQAVSTLTSDPMMAKIFGDTANTTLADQESGESYQVSGGDAAGFAVAQHEPSELFEGSDKWAQLAFAPSKKLARTGNDG